MSAGQPDLTGMTFGSWRVVGAAPSSPQGHRQWVVACSCGSLERIVRAFNLLRALSTSCGACDVATSPKPVRKGPPKPRLGPEYSCKTPEYLAWADAKARCYRSNHKDFRLYGARGVQVCDRWRGSYKAFLDDLGRRPTPKHTLDRWPNKNGHYEPGNVRWATQKQQQRNRRNNRLLLFRGHLICLAEAAELAGLNAQTLTARLNREWSLDKAMTTPSTRLDRDKALPKNIPTPRIRIRKAFFT